ncbi:MAG TPA: hypothetical protein VGW38_00770 [Chloroflexota bacterium]|nr:hypothetical protein [Chloroflexota bacterium]
MSKDDDFVGPRWLRRVDPRYRRLVGGATFIAVLLLLKLVGLREWLSRQPVAVAAVPVMLLGMACVAMALGPQRWIERDIEKTKRNPFALGGGLLGRLPIWGVRIFFLAFGLAASVGGSLLLTGRVE